jgi:hypothetical protein
VSGTCENQGDLLAGWYFAFEGDGNRVKQVYTLLGQGFQPAQPVKSGFNGKVSVFHSIPATPFTISRK